MGYTSSIFSTLVIFCMANGDPDILGGRHWVYLEDVAKQYIRKINATYKGNVATWGLTDKYSYWRYHSPHEKHPVRAKISWTSYSECQGASSLNEREGKCTGSFLWKISAGISSPVSIKYEEQVPVVYRGLRRKLLKFDISDLTKESADERWRRPRGQVRRKLVKACKFGAEIYFEGYFVYTLSNPKEGNFRWVFVSIAELAGMSKGLRAKGDELSYVVKGIYVERISCYGRKKY